MLIGGTLFFVLSLFLYGDDRIHKIEESLISSYPQVLKIEKNRLFFRDGSSLLFDDKKEKTTKEALEHPDIEDMFRVEYDKNLIAPQDASSEAGRFRNEEFFKKIYGSSRDEIEKNLQRVSWFDGTKIDITTINGVNKRVERISEKISKLPDEIKSVAKEIAGGYYYRTIRGTKRLSAHSFGIAIDLNLKSGEYWLFDLDKTGSYRCCKKEIPKEIVEAFEEEGFIWGGRWHSYDTIHFEYRPELLRR